MVVRTPSVKAKTCAGPFHRRQPTGDLDRVESTMVGNFAEAACRVSAPASVRRFS
jgi:hypothetical protein